MDGTNARLEHMRATLRREAAVLQELANDFDEGASRAVDLLLGTGGHVLIGGAGTSNAVAWRFAHLLSCCGLPALFLDPAEGLHGGSGAVKPEDTVILISKEGRSLEVNAFGLIVKQRGEADGHNRVAGFGIGQDGGRGCARKDSVRKRSLRYGGNLEFARQRSRGRCHLRSHPGGTRPYQGGVRGDAPSRRRRRAYATGGNPQVMGRRPVFTMEVLICELPSCMSCASSG